MSFLSTNNSEFLSARITQKGRNAIAKGSFNINYFQIGDSEYDYNLIFSGLTGNTNHQMIMSPSDRESGIKYPYKIDSSTSGTTYGVPVNNNIAPESIRNVMGAAGFVTESEAPIIKTYTELHPLTMITGGTTLLVTSGNKFNETDTVTIAFTTFGGVDPENPVITGVSTSLVYKIISITGNTLTLDRPFPDLSVLSGNFQIVVNYAELEYPITGTTCQQPTIDNLHQHNPWTLDVVWDSLRPIGTNNSGNENSLSGYTSNKHTSTKEYLGYSTNTGQTFTDLTGGTITYPTSYKNSFDEIINVTPEDQRSIAVIHYSELGNLINDPERFYKYDDYISTLTTDPIYLDLNDNELTDTEYFEVYIPFIHYHRHIHSGTTIGALFTMDSTDYYINSTINNKHKLLFRYLLDLQNNKVGKVFPNNKIVVFDDQELVAILDLRSNRRYTLPAPKLNLINSDTNTSFFTNSGQTLWFTYALSNQNDTLNGLPCNYYSKIDSTTTPSNVGFKFSGDEFHFIGGNFTDFTTGYIAQNFYIFYQITNVGDLPESDNWMWYDYTDRVGGNGVSYINPTGLTGTTFTLTFEQIDPSNPIINYQFNLDEIMGTNYTSLTNTQFGEEQTFPGSVRLVRASDIESMNFLVNLPSTQFTETQNPTYVSGDKRITEIALLDSNKEPLVVAKTPIPIKRIGTQVFSLKLDF